MPFPESIIIGVVEGCDFDCASAERRVYEFCIGDYWECYIGK